MALVVQLMKLLTKLYWGFRGFVIWEFRVLTAQSFRIRKNAFDP